MIRRGISSSCAVFQPLLTVEHFYVATPPFRSSTGPLIGTNFWFQITSCNLRSRDVYRPRLPSSGRNDESDVLNTYIFIIIVLIF